MRIICLYEQLIRKHELIGKPEPLKYLASGTWSRRLTEEHRIVYFVQKDRIDFLQARYHY
ncbi:Txe/YoeB family addiction module toxin [candidate division KSB1 bacterium]|nr:Txe/YoeB family addiction module toxin [candidate division KSB1 bacterium]